MTAPAGDTVAGWLSALDLVRLQELAVIAAREQAVALGVRVACEIVEDEGASTLVVSVPGAGGAGDD